MFPTEKGGRRASKDCLSFPVEAGVALGTLGPDFASLAR